MQPAMCCAYATSPQAGILKLSYTQQSSTYHPSRTYHILYKFRNPLNHIPLWYRTAIVWAPLCAIRDIQHN